MARATRIEMDDTKIDNIFANIEKLLLTIYPQLTKDKFWTYPTSGLRLAAWRDPATRTAVQLYIQPGKKLPKGEAKMHIFAGGWDGQEAINLGDFITKFRKLKPNASYGAGGGYAKAAPNLMVFVEDMI